MKKWIISAVLGVALGFAGAAMAITPPVVTQPKAGIVQFTWSLPTTRVGGVQIAATDIRECRLYLTNEANYIAVPAPTASYTYIVPFGYTTQSTDTAVATCVDSEGRLSPLSNVAAMPVGVTSPKPLLSAPGGLTAVRAP